MDRKTKEYLDSQFNPGFLTETKAKELPGSGTGTQVVGYIPPGFTAQDVLEGKAVGWKKRGGPAIKRKTTLPPETAEYFEGVARGE